MSARGDAEGEADVEGGGGRRQPPSFPHAEGRLGISDCQAKEHRVPVSARVLGVPARPLLPPGPRPRPALGPARALGPRPCAPRASQVCGKSVDRDCPMVALSVQSTAGSGFGFRFLRCPPLTADACGRL